MQIVLYYDNQLIAKKIKKQVQAMKVDETKVLHIDKLTCDVWSLLIGQRGTGLRRWGLG